MKPGNYWFNYIVRAEHGIKFQFLLQYALTKLRTYLSIFIFLNIFPCTYTEVIF